MEAFSKIGSIHPFELQASGFLPRSGAVTTRKPCLTEGFIELDPGLVFVAESGREIE